MGDKRTLHEHQRAILRDCAKNWSKLLVFGIPVDECALSIEEVRGLACIAMGQEVPNYEVLRYMLPDVPWSER